MAAKDPRHDTAEGQAEPRVAAADELHDTALHEEIELVGQLVVAATSTPHRLSQREIDKVLGVGTSTTSRWPFPALGERLGMGT